MDISSSTHVPIVMHRAFHGLPAGKSDTPVATTLEVDEMLFRDAVVAVGVSGGKDSDACAIAVSRYLDGIGHAGPRILVHSDLGRVEWADSLPSCERLARSIGWELMVVRRAAGDMLARWQTRWANNVARYNSLECVKLILPWSTPSMRFCTSELKVSVITAALKKRFPGQDIVNVAGIRRQESATRQKMPVSARQPKLEARGSKGVTWNAIIEWPIEDVLATIRSQGLVLHEAYTKYGASRVSCAFCIMSSEQDLQAASACENNAGVYAAMVELEADSSFAFQGHRWLGDTAPHLITAELLQRVARAKEIAIERQGIEATIPRHLLYTSGWPTAMPTGEEAALLAWVRTKVSGLLGLDASHLTAASVRDRYAELLAAKAQKEGVEHVE